MRVYDLRIFVLTLFPVALFSERIQPESYYQKIAAEKYGGETEVAMPDGTRCDIVTEKHAIEVDFADKWAEAIGQSLNYGFQTNKRAGILLIIETRADERHLLRVNSIIEHYGLQIDVLAIRAWEEEFQ
ncbi:MAG: hypothetical protein AAF065_14695 [Verrucomicrobiota bacterium]